MYFTEIFGPIKWHMLVCAAVFYGIPPLGYVLPGQYAAALYLTAGALCSLVIGLSCIILTIKKGFKWYYPLIVIVLYTPSLMMFYDVSMSGNIIAYLGLAYASQVIGHIIGKLIERNR